MFDFTFICFDQVGSGEHIKTLFTAFIDWFSDMRISDVNEHICRVFIVLVTFETLARCKILERLQLFRICVEHQPLPLLAYLNKTFLFFFNLSNGSFE